MNIRENDASTSLYLVRIWKRRSPDSAQSVHDKLQHVVSGASSYFEGLSSLPEALEQMMAQQSGSYTAEDCNQAHDGP